MWKNSVVQWFRAFRQGQGWVKAGGANPAESQSTRAFEMMVNQGIKTLKGKSELHKKVCEINDDFKPAC